MHLPILAQLTFLLSEAQPQNAHVTPLPPPQKSGNDRNHWRFADYQGERERERERERDFTFLQLYISYMYVCTYLQLYNVQASLNHRPKACSCSSFEELMALWYTYIFPILVYCIRKIWQPCSRKNRNATSARVTTPYVT
jgi:hypothetical protein